MRASSSFRFELGIGLIAATALAVACSPSSPELGPEAGDAPATRAGDEDRYKVRGLVVEIPETVGGAVLRIRHEAIPDFKGFDGKVWDGGMESMTMNFAVAQGVSFAGVSVGEKVEFVLVVDWEKTPTQAITEIVTLPPETELDFTPPTDDVP